MGKGDQGRGCASPVGPPGMVLAHYPGVPAGEAAPCVSEPSPGSPERRQDSLRVPSSRTAQLTPAQLHLLVQQQSQQGQYMTQAQTQMNQTHGVRPDMACRRHHSRSHEDCDDNDSSDFEDDSDCSCCEGDADRDHFRDVCFSMLNYADDVSHELSYLQETYADLDAEDQALLMRDESDNNAMLKAMAKAVRVNAEFLTMLVHSDEDAREFQRIPPDYEVHDRNAVKVRTVLRQFVRDWADEGAEERAAQYEPLIGALERHVPRVSGQRPPRVLCPGSGLSRLPFECCRRGYSAQGNEFSYHMLQGAKWVLNETQAVRTHTIYPFVLGLNHRRGACDHLRAVKVPDVCPTSELCPGGAPSDPQREFSMCAGEFVEVYQHQTAEWDAVLTCFFIDTAKNVFLYIRTIATIVREGGVWANIGPLLYHYAEQTNAISIELSWEEVKPAIADYFDFQEEELREAHYTTNAKGLFHTRYRCKFFVAIRNSVPVVGQSKPVF